MTEYKILAKTSKELLDSEWEDIVDGFNTAFKKSHSLSYFKTKYAGTSLGYSVHGLLYFNDKVVGQYVALPRLYSFKGKEVSVAFGCDAFILKENRNDESFLKNMVDATIQRSKEEGVFYYISMPNATSYPYWKYYIGWKEMGKLNYYIVPFRVSKIAKLPRFTNFFSKISTQISFQTITTSNNHAVEKPIALVKNKKYITDRYFDSYNKVQIKEGGSFIYKIYKEDNIQTAYLLDYHPSTKKNLKIAIRHILKVNKKFLDVVMYIGNLERKPKLLLKVTEKNEPRKQLMFGLCLQEQESEHFFDLKNWELGLANFDNR